jgi:hypothetical protein
MELPLIAWPELTGYLACGLVFLTFCMKRMLPLRLIAIASNIAFLVYGYTAELVPIFLLHTALLPLNIYRTVQKVRELKSIRQAAEGRAEIDVLIPYMTQKKLPKDTVLFERGDTADAIYFLAAGSLWIPEVDITLESGDLVGEIGIFHPDKKRTASALCKTDCELFQITEKDVQALLAENPQFGIFLTKLITQRLLQNSAFRSNVYMQETGV